MKKQVFLFWLAGCLLATAGMANKVIIKGTIGNATGGVVPGKTVYTSVLPASNTNGCTASDSTKTNPNGYFIDTLFCDVADIKKVAVSTRNCNGEWLQKIVEVPADGIVTVAFVLQCPPQACRPEFKFERADNNGLLQYFNSKESVAGPQDSIIRRVWTFGDGTANEGNAIEVKKEYKQPGSYQVCLKIFTKNGCSQTLCKTVVVGPNSPPACKATFRWEPVPASPNNGAVFHFFSSLITATPDSIVARTWIFGDGDTLKGNESNPKHRYRQPGKYEVCLIIKTKNGCESRQCQPLVVAWPKCKPGLRFEILPKTNDGYPVRFNSFLPDGAAAPGDSVVWRQWTFGNGAVLRENIANPLHVFRQPGTYTICLSIKTKNGCEDSSCVILSIPPPPAACQAKWEMETKERWVYLNARPSVVAPGDSIIKYIWRFGDGTLADGTEAATKHQYEKPGQYEICLVIVTKRGCESKMCKLVTVPGTAINQPRCEARFAVARRDGNKVQFDSKMSVALVAGDSIVSRRWDFGNGTVLTGNVLSPVTEFPPFGARYNVCLSIRTAKGCESKFCMVVEAKQTASPNDSSRVWLIRHFPNPVQKTLYAVIFSPRDNEQVEVAVLDVYGIVKSTIKWVVPKGHSTHAINTGSLLAGPYLLRIRTSQGVQSRNFYKVN